MDVEEKRILASAFEQSDEWQKALKILQRAYNDFVEVCKDNQSSLEEIRYAQGAIAAIESFKMIPSTMFEEDE